MKNWLRHNPKRFLPCCQRFLTSFGWSGWTLSITRAGRDSLVCSERYSGVVHLFILVCPLICPAFRCSDEVGSMYPLWTWQTAVQHGSRHLSPLLGCWWTSCPAPPLSPPTTSARHDAVPYGGTQRTKDLTQCPSSINCQCLILVERSGSHAEWSAFVACVFLPDDIQCHDKHSRVAPGWHFFPFVVGVFVLALVCDVTFLWM